MQIALTINERYLLVKGLVAIDTPAYEKQIRKDAQELAKKIKNSIPREIK